MNSTAVLAVGSKIDYDFEVRQPCFEIGMTLAKETLVKHAKHSDMSSQCMWRNVEVQECFRFIGLDVL